MGKGSQRRPCLVGKEELELRWKLAQHRITFAEFGKRYAKLRTEGKITRSGRIVGRDL